jgi:hypothetical protein
MESPKLEEPDMPTTNAHALMLAQPDPRADGGVRHVRVTRSEVLILRRFAGVNMRILAPVAAYRGVALVVESAEDGGVAYRLSLAHADPDFDVVLAETPDSRAVAEDWSFWAEYLDLPRLAEEGGAGVVSGSPNVTFSRVSNSVVAKRRPRFLARRKRGDAARTRVVFANEREIVAYE